MTEPPEADVADELPRDPDVDRAADVRGRPGSRPGSARVLGTAVRRRVPRLPAAVLGVVFLGGVAGGLARHAVTEGWPTPPAAFPWSYFVVNTTGAFALPLLVVIVADILRPTRLVRPALGTGFLGAFTTFSSVMTGTDQLLAHGHPGTAVLYLAASILAALGAAWFGLVSGRALVVTRRRASP